MSAVDDKMATEGAVPVAPSTPIDDTKEHHHEPDIEHSSRDLNLPSGWMYRQRKIGSIHIPWYASPKVQLVMVSFVCFLCPGMFNALGGMGGGGKSDAKLADQMNTAVYSTFAVFGFFGGTFINKLGVKVCLAFGGIGYCIYAASLLASVHAYVQGFNIFAGALLGCCAGLLWTAQGTIMVSYPPENQKGRYFGWFWAIFNLGAVIGSLIPLGQNIHVRTNTTVTDGTYIAFIVLMFLGAVIALALVNGNKVIRDDGSRVVLMKHPSWKSEFIGLYESFRFEPAIILLFPMFWSSNWFYAYQQNAVNGARFGTRTKALNSCLYYLAQIVGAFGLGFFLDMEKVRRSLRAKVAWGFLMVMTMAIWGGGYAYAKLYDRASVATGSGFVPMDWSDKGYLGPMFLYIFYGMYDSFWQATVYWYIGALTNSGRRSANYVGFYKGIQSSGGAVTWALDSIPISFMGEFASNWALLGGSLLIAAPIIFLRIKDTVSVESDLEGTDETLADVLPPSALKGDRIVT